MPMTSSGSKLVSTALAIAAILGLSACGGSDDGGATASSGSSAATASADRPAWCGEREITFALADGFGDNSWRKVTVAEARDEASKCPSVKEFIYTNGQGDTQKSISDIQGLTAQGVNALVVFADQGKAVLPAIREAYNAGVVTVPYRVFPGGEAGKDYDAYIRTDFSELGELWARWLVRVLDGRGNIAYLGGPPANTQNLEQYEGMQRVFRDYPDIRFVGQAPYNVTDWDAARTQQVLSALLAKYPRIDAVAVDFGFASAVSAFRQARREIPAVVTEDSNQLSCMYQELKADNPRFELFTVESQTWMVRTAVRYAVAKATGGELPDVNVPQRAFEDSVSGRPNPVTCVETLPPDSFASSQLSTEAQAAALK